MSRSTISTYQLFQKYPDAESARKYFESRLWPNGPICPTCRKGERIGIRKGGFYRCNACKLDFTVRTGTIFERSHVPLHKWLYSMYLLVTSRKGISSLQLGKEIGIRQASAWFLLHRLREACGNDLTMLRGIVEVDEAYIGGLEENRHFNKRMNIGGGKGGKTVIIALKERGGRVKAEPIIGTGSISLQNAVEKHVEKGATIHTDEYQGYNKIRSQYKHQSINHKAGEYSVKGVTTNGVESVFAVLKRGLHGVYHHASPKHMGRYVDEFTFRLNDANVRRHTWDRLDSLVSAVAGKRLTYKRLTA
jgi:transposase-like protein